MNRPAAEEDENEVIIYERYATKADLTDVHNSGAVFKAFGKRLGEQDLKGAVALRKQQTSCAIDSRRLARRLGPREIKSDLLREQRRFHAALAVLVGVDIPPGRSARVHHTRRLR